MAKDGRRLPRATWRPNRKLLAYFLLPLDRAKPFPEGEPAGGIAERVGGLDAPAGTYRCAEHPSEGSRTSHGDEAEAPGNEETLRVGQAV